MPALIKDLTGQRFGRLVVLRFLWIVPRGNNKRKLWSCECDCGKVCAVFGHNLSQGTTKSCGCYRREVAPVNGYKKHERARV